jgi:SusD family.
MIMKKIIYSFLAIALINSACQKKVLDLTPKDLLISDLAFSTPEKIENAVMAGYDGLQDDDFLSGRALVYVDLRGEDVFDRQTYFGTIPRFTVLANSTTIADLWTAGYSAIGRANRAMEGVEANADKLDPGKDKELIAECKFVRGVAHFYLVNFFAQPYVFTADASHIGIPIITQSFVSNDPEANQPRASVAEVYNQVIKDLTEALVDIPEAYTNPDHDKVRGTKAAVASFLSRVYLYMGDFNNAKQYALKVINGDYGHFELNAAVDGAFGPGNYQTPETIWSIANNANDNPNTNNSLPMHYYPEGRGDLPISNSFLDVATNPYFALDDKRRDMIIPGVPATNTQAYKFTRKYTDISTRADWAPIIRYAEVLLNYAEAQARIANDVDADAIAKLNEVRDRARVSEPSYTVGSFANKDELIAAILGERRIELAFEGHRFWDLQRNKLPVTNKYDSDGTSLLPTQPFGSTKNIFPIPQAEVDKSKGVLEQNKDY